MERLTKRAYTISEPHVEIVTAVPGVNVTNILDRLATYEDAEEQGLLVRLPCKVGNTVYTESNIKGLISSFPAPDETWVFENRAEFGHTVFLTREEAEAALVKEREP